MSLKDMFSRDRVVFDLKSESKSDVLDELIEVLIRDGKIESKEIFREAVIKREQEFSTGIGMGIAIPHGKSSTVKEACIVFGKSNSGVDYESMDDEPAYLFFLIAVPMESDDIHLRALAEISRKLMHNEIREGLMKVGSFEEFIKVFE